MKSVIDIFDQIHTMKKKVTKLYLNLIGLETTHINNARENQTIENQTRSNNLHVIKEEFELFIKHVNNEHLTITHYIASKNNILSDDDIDSMLALLESVQLEYDSIKQKILIQA